MMSAAARLAGHCRCRAPRFSAHGGVGVSPYFLPGPPHRFPLPWPACPLAVRQFVQSFFLSEQFKAPKSNSYFVLNDNFRLIGQTATTTATPALAAAPPAPPPAAPAEARAGSVAGAGLASGAGLGRPAGLET